MPYSNLTFNVSTNLSFKPNDFVQLNGSLITTTTTTTTAVPLPVITSGLVLYVDASIPSSYPGTGTTWYDLSPSGYNGTLSGDATYSSIDGGYIALQSNTGYIDFGLSSQGSNTSAYTWGGWFNVPGFTTIPMTRGGGTDSYPNGWNLATVFLSNAFNGSMITSVPGITQTNASYSSTPSTNTWYNHITVWNPGVSLKVYINGVLGATVNTSNTVLRNSSQGWNTSIDGTKGNASYGSMMVYNTVLSDDDVVQNFNSTCTRFGLSPITTTTTSTTSTTTTAAPTTTTTTTTAASPIVTAGLVLNLDAGNSSSYPGTGTTWFDISGNSNNATLTSYGAGVPSYSSIAGGAILFTRNAFNVGNSAIFPGGSSFANLTTEVTLSLWFYTGTNTTMILAGKGYQFETVPYEIQSYQININGGTINARITAGGSTSNTDLNSSSLSLNTWTNVTLTYDGSNIIIYINGTLANSTSKSGLMTAIYSLPFIISGQTTNISGTTASEFYNGYIGQVLLYNTALTAGQVLQNFNGTKTRFGL